MSDLSNLKSGDKVLVGNRYASYVTNVVRITPKGFIVVPSANGATELTFKQNGNERGGSSWSSCWLSHWTQEAEDKIKQAAMRGKMLAQINQVVWRNLNDDQLRRIVSILDEGKNEVQP